MTCFLLSAACALPPHCERSPRARPTEGESCSSEETRGGEDGAARLLGAGGGRSGDFTPCRVALPLDTPGNICRQKQWGEFKECPVVSWSQESVRRENDAAVISAPPSCVSKWRPGRRGRAAGPRRVRLYADNQHGIDLLKSSLIVWL